MVFFGTEDYELYKKFLRQWVEKTGVSIWCYCLMPNHVHLEAETVAKAGFAQALGGTHSAYARAVNHRNDCTGHLWPDFDSSAHILRRESKAPRVIPRACGVTASNMAQKS